MASDLELSLGLDASGFSQSSKIAIEQSKELKKGFKDYGDLFAAGGITTAVLGFFSNAIQYAKDYKGAFNTNIEATKEFGKTWDSIKNVVGEAGVATVGFITKASSGLGLMVQAGSEARDAFEKAIKNGEGLGAATTAYRNAIAKVRDVNQESLALDQKISEQKAYQAKHADELKKIAGDIEAIDKERNNLALQGLTTQETVNNLVNQLAKARKEEAAGSEDLVTRAKQHLAVKESALALAKSQLQLEKENAAKQEKEFDELTQQITKQVKFHEAEADFARQQLTAAGQVVAINKELVEVAGKISVAEKNGVDTEILKTRELELQKGLRDAEAKKLADTIEISGLLLKGTENLTESEKLRLDILTGQTTQLKINAEIADLTGKLINGTITEAERERLRLITGQVVASQNLQSSMDDQRRTALEILNAEEKRLGILQTIRQQSVGQHYGDKNLSDLSDAELAQKIAALTSQYSSALAAPIRDNLGYQQDTGVDFAQRKLQEARNEAQRRQLLNFYSGGSEGAGVGTSASDRITAQNARNLQDIADRLSGRKEIGGLAPAR